MTRIRPRKSSRRRLGLDEKKLRKQLKEAVSLERKFVPIVKGLDDVEAAAINSKLETAGLKKADLPRFPGLHWREDQKRSYPNGELAAHVVGFSNAEGVGQAGIEQSQNEGLFGAVIKKTQERDRLGRVYDEVVAEQEAPNDVMLTIDSAIQYTAEEALARPLTTRTRRRGSRSS
jgi:cell division protein FtsI/penicillin-binding protein 2